MKRLISILLAMTLLLGAFPLVALAADEGWYVVDSTEPKGYCYMYSKPSSMGGDSRNLGRYDNGEIIFVMDYDAGQEGRDQYAYVQALDDKTGYIRVTCLKRYYGTVETAADKTGWYVVSSTEPRGYCYLYSTPSSMDDKSRNLGRYDNGKWIYVLDYYAGEEGGDYYCRVQTLDGKSGYIRATCLARSISSSGSSNNSNNNNSSSTVTYPAKLRNLPALSYQCRGTVQTASTSVYTGPSSSYYRTNAGKAYVAKGETLSVYGREGDYYLISYSAASNGKSITRFSFIPVNRFYAKGDVDTLNYSWVPIRIVKGAHMSDAPEKSHQYTDISVDRSSAFALAKFTDSAGDMWVYFESIGYSESRGYVSVRGFVPMDDVELR